MMTEQELAVQWRLLENNGLQGNNILRGELLIDSCDIALKFNDKYYEGLIVITNYKVK